MISAKDHCVAVENEIATIPPQLDRATRNADRENTAPRKQYVFTELRWQEIEGKQRYLIFRTAERVHRCTSHLQTGPHDRWFFVVDKRMDWKSC